MSAARHFLRGTSLFRTTTAANHYKPLLSSTANSFLSPLFSRYCSSSDAVTISDAHDEIPTPTPTPTSLPQRQPHPWPEWVSFVDGLETKGYVAVHASDRNVYIEIDQLKLPCLRFARDRHDVFKSLSMPDIQTLVEGGCPHISRKAVNSAKRLRAYLRMEEAEVCSKCNLRDSCSRAYAVLEDSEADPRTVDIMRILLLYALDPVVFSLEKPPGRDLFEDSARKLLSELIELIEKVDDPSLPKDYGLRTSKKDVHRKLFKDIKMKKRNWTCPKCNFINFARNFQCLKCQEERSENVDAEVVELKRGDWICSECNFMNFAKNLECLKCKEERPKKVDAEDVELKKGDWICSVCNFMNFAKNLECLKCKEQRPNKVDFEDVELKKGDWICPDCGFPNFAIKRACISCRTARPQRMLLLGDWECPSCDFMNFRRNTACKRCNGERPESVAVSEQDEKTQQSLE